MNTFPGPSRGMNDNISPELVVTLARYAGLSFEENRAEALAHVLGPALANLRKMRPKGYENLAPDLNFRVPTPNENFPR